MSRLPDALDTVCALGPCPFSVAARAVWAAARESGLPPVTGYALPAHASERSDDIEQALATLVADAERLPDLRLEFAPTGFAVLSTRSGDGKWKLHLNLASDADVATCLRLLQQHAELLRRLLRSGILERATVKRIGPGLLCVPMVPLAATAQILVTDASEVAAAYDDPAAFFGAGWTAETFGERVLLSRAMHCADDVAYLHAIYHHQWAMARAAKAGATGYFAPRPLADELPLYRVGKPRLVPVGHLAQGNIVEYSAVLEPDQHLRGWEVFELRRVLRAKTLPDGRPVESVRVVFLERAMAERERRPLLDIGARVYFQGATDIEEITG